MKPFVKKTTEQPSKRAVKKSINIRWNSRLYFQIGLIVSMLLAFGAMEITYEVAPDVFSDNEFILDEDHGPIDFVIDFPKKKEIAVVKKPVIKPPVREKVDITKLQPIKNGAVHDGPDIPSTDLPLVDTSPTTGSTTTPPPVEYGTRNVVNVEHVPVFPGCESMVGNKAKVNCMSSKIAAFVNRKFRTDDFDDLSGDPIQKIYVQFKIDKSGNVVEIKANSKHAALENEAKRVIAKLPVMKPGKQGITPVDVIYIVPISLQISY
jgi:protein TonB